MSFFKFRYALVGTSDWDYGIDWPVRNCVIADIVFDVNNECGSESRLIVARESVSGYINISIPYDH